MTDGSAHERTQENEAPEAVIRSPEQIANSRLRTRLWWLTALCAILAAGVVISNFKSQGIPISVRFQDGHGLKAGDTLRFRGIDVGAVTEVRLSEDLQVVDVSILLSNGNEKIAVVDSQFWIERARVRLGQVSGLDTVLGAKYVGVVPGDSRGSPATEFIGREAPLNITQGDSKEIKIQFPAGEGLEVGDPIRYRGISVGEVTYVELSEAADSVGVGVRLVGASRQLARAGTQFWIERPRLDLTEIRGLETLLGGRYIAMEPAPEQAPLQGEFVGLAEPPPLPRRDGSLEVELDAPSRLGLVRGAPIAYRGLEVGRVSNVGLSSDGATVKIGAVVDAEYADLVRANSKWWAIGGIKIDANLRGVHIAFDSLSAWLRGGIAFATPESPGRHVVTGHRFMLEEEADPQWLEWQPRIAVGHSQVYGRELPRPVRVVASWNASWVGLYRRNTAECWGIAISDKHLRVPKQLVEEAQEAGAEVKIELAGKSFVFDPKRVVVSGALAKIEFPGDAKIATWPAKNITRKWTEKTVLMVVNPELGEPLALDGTRVSVLKGIGLKIAPGVPFSEALHGSPVIDSQSGKLFGLLLQEEEGWKVGNILDVE